ncbi:MAG: D-alanyl-D-alanine carboxypeptidase [Hyphomicrobiaceae bacterium]
MAHTHCVSQHFPGVGGLNWAPVQIKVLVTAMFLATMVCPLATLSAASVKGKKATYVFDANRGRALHADRAFESRYPASLTKMMTLYLVFELIEQKRLSYATRIYASKRAAAQPPSRIGLKRGEHLTIRQAVMALVTKSANDVATAIAEHISGTEPKFARLMTAEARRLGMKKTTFRNASGLPNANQVTTAHDMAILAMRLQDHFPKHYKHFSLRSFTHKGRKYRNHNALLGRYSGIDGIKTGYTRASGFNLVTSLRHKGRHVIAVVMGGRTGRARNARMRRLLDKHVASASRTRTRRPTLRLALLRRPQQAKRNERRLARAAGTAMTNVANRQHQTVRRPSRNQTGQHSPRSGDAGPIDRQQSGPNIRVARVRHIDLRFPSRTSAQRSPRVSSEYQLKPREHNQARVGYRRATPRMDQAREGIHQSSSEPTSPASSPPIRNDSRYVSRPSPPDGNYHIQVGAFSSVAEARRRLANVTAQVSPLLREVRATAVAVATRNRYLFRARYVGLTSRAARSACKIMRQQRIECFVVAAKN